MERKIINLVEKIRSKGFIVYLSLEKFHAHIENDKNVIDPSIIVKESISVSSLERLYERLYDLEGRIVSRDCEMRDNIYNVNAKSNPYPDMVNKKYKKLQNALNVRRNKKESQID